MRLTRVVALTAAFGWLAAGSALAASVDFTSGAWSGAAGDTSFGVGDVTLTSSVVGGLTFNGGFVERAGCLAANLLEGASLACAGDGIGIVDDEVGGVEVLTISFSSPVTIFGVDVLDLFQDGLVAEGVQFSLDGISWSPAYLTAGNFGGYLSTGFTADATSVLYLRGAADGVSDLALARIEYEAVPEPGTLALVGMGLAGLAARARRGATRA